MSSSVLFRSLAILVLAWGVSGCITQLPTPSYALSGDLVQVGLGGIKRNTNGKTLFVTDIQATITDGNGTYPLKIETLYRAYPDYTSWYARDSLVRSDPIFGEVEPYDGMWWLTVRLAEEDNTPLPLVKGPATISVSAVNPGDLFDTGWENEGTLGDFPIEILEDAAVRTRIPNLQEKDQYVAYRARRGLIVQPDSLAGIADVGGFQVELRYNTSALATSAPVAPRLVPISHDPNLTVIQSTRDNGDGTRTLVAMVTNPNGFVPNADLGSSWAIGKSTFADLQFGVLVKDESDLDDGWESNYWLEGANSFYIDSNGDVLALVSPVLSRNY